MTTSEGPHVVDVPGPLCSEAEFTDLMESMVAGCAPRVFAVVQELGDRANGWIAAWGIAFDDRAEVIGVDGDVRLSVETPELAVLGFGRCPHITAHVVWVGGTHRG